MRQPPPRQSPRNHRGEVIYIIDSDIAIRDALALLCKGLGFKVEAFSSGSEFLDAIPTKQTGCILSSAELEDMDGIEFMKSLRSLEVSIPLILLSNSSDIATAVEAIQSGVFDYIEKPFFSTKLAAKIKLAVEKSYTDSLQSIC